MPVITYIPQDPTDLVIAGEQMRVSVQESLPTDGPVLIAGNQVFASGLQSIVQDEDALLPMNSFIEGNMLSMRRMKNLDLQRRVNAGIATPCGAWLPLDYSPLLNPLLWASNLFAVSGVTRDSASSPLGGCRVVCLETGRVSAEGLIEAQFQSAGNPNPADDLTGGTSPYIGETISDGSGNYSVPVPMNTAYQLIGYKPGSPDVAGITRSDVTPTHIG